MRKPKPKHLWKKRGPREESPMVFKGPWPKVKIRLTREDVISQNGAAHQNKYE